MFRLIQLIVTLLIAISLLRSVVNFVQRLWAGTQARTPIQQNARQPSSTMLQQDPVCGTYVAVDTSLKRLHHGRVIHFCSPECRDRYIA